MGDAVVGAKQHLSCTAASLTIVRLATSARICHELTTNWAPDFRAAATGPSRREDQAMWSSSGNDNRSVTAERRR